ncbi:nicotinamide-nucleotide amidase [Enterobacillus tribolii]|uniref:Nicotinamide-nucleotide amidase n=1 Tax=Enterobacillus tribolii TaxID=1487935 RepID=A0A370Q887_9GAMM|nr:nicotinamide-nucleotide amidase [Enterobacillus tribolii]MBW7984576.1 nicotinamide-nucleotide amidase [Enterobacillus tribolii]RDK84566.1 nicotinamide-nucleotide amidase [Enterobacillus tribolii]
MDNDELYQLSVTLGERLKAKGAWFTCAESCTGGLIAKTVTDVAGSSAYFDRGFVTYSNEAKHELLRVSRSVLERYGAVSEQVVEEMASGALGAAGADIAVAVSGIAGPDGGTPDKPVGTVWFGFADKEGRIFASCQRFPGSRREVRFRAAEFALRTIIDKFL